MTLQQFIKKRPYLIWYTKNYKGLTEDAILESVLNYGDWDDVQTLFKIIGIKKAAQIFKKQAARKRNNYNLRTRNYFKLFFKKYA